jgi:hypothetical protein
MLPDTTMEETIPPPETIVSITYGDFQNLLNRLSYLETIQDEAKNHVTELISDSQQKNARFHTLETAVASIGSTTATPREGEPKVADPEPFCGDRLKLLDFLAKCQLKFLGQPSRFSTEKSKIIYAGALLEKEAFSWFQPHFIKAVSTGVYPPEIIDFKAMSESLTALYGDPDLETSSENALRRLQQTQDVPHYTAQFERLAQYVKWNDAAKLDQFYEGLRSNVKDELMHQERPKTLIAMKTAATRCDTRIRQRISERASRSNDKKPSPANNRPMPHTPSTATNPNVQSPPGIPLFTADGTVPMALNSTVPYPRIKRDPLTPEEKQRRRDNNLCLYCADPAHQALQCPRAPKRSDPNRFLNETQYSFSVAPSSVAPSVVATNEDTRERF